MTPERLTATGTSEERELLRSALQDRATPGAKAQLVAVLAGGATLAAAAAAEGATLVSGAGASGAGAGVAATGAAGTGIAATGAAVAGAGSAGVGTAAGTAGIGLLGVAKWVGIGLLAGTTTTAVVATTAAPPAAEVEEPAAVVTSVPEAPRLRPQPEDPGTEVTPVPVVAVESAATPSARPRVGEEIEVLDRARTALGQGDVAEAGRTLGEYRRSFRGGAMGPEAAVLDVRVALARGDRERAASLARSFLVRHPDSPHAPRMRALLARATTPSGPAGAGEAPIQTRQSDPLPPAAATAASDDVPTATPSRTPSVARFAD